MNEPTALAVYTLAEWQKQLTELAYDLMIRDKSREQVAKELILMAGFFARNLEDVAEQVEDGETDIKCIISTK